MQGTIALVLLLFHRLKLTEAGFELRGLRFLGDGHESNIMVHGLLLACARLLDNAESIFLSRLQSLIMFATLGSTFNKLL